MIAPTVTPVKAPEEVKLVTAEELLRLPSSERYELVRGVLVPMSPPPGYQHGRIAMRLGRRIANYADENDLGEVTAAETGFRPARNPDTVHAADVAFVSKSRLPAKLPRGYLDLAPDLVAEIVSAGDDPDEIQTKVKEWLEAGVKMVLVVYPGSQQIVLYRSLRQVAILTSDDTFTAPDILPGFACPVSEIFAE